jgi:hypothetical protein
MSVHDEGVLPRKFNILNVFGVAPCPQYGNSSWIVGEEKSQPSEREKECICELANGMCERISLKGKRKSSADPLQYPTEWRVELNALASVPTSQQ